MTETTLPTPNLDLLRQLVRWAELDEAKVQATGLGLATPAADPQFAAWGHWDQGAWAQIATWKNGSAGARPGTPQSEAEVDALARNGLCGTAYCIAGQAVAQHGYMIVIPEDGVVEQCVKTVMTDQVDRWGFPIREPYGDQEYIWEVAQEVLGLTDDEADNLFSSANNVRDLKVLVNDVCESRDLEPAYPELVDDDHLG